MNRFFVATAPLFLLAGLIASPANAEEPPRKRPTDEQRGKELYDRHCEACHGSFNNGDGPATQALVRPVPDLEGKVDSSNATVDLVLRGKGAMPAYEQTFDRFDAKRVLDFMASLEAPDPSAAPEPEEPANGSEPTPDEPSEKTNEPQ